MKRSRFFNALLRITLLLNLGVWGASASWAEINHQEALRLKQTGAILSLEEIVARVRSLKPGIIIETELDFEKGRYVYEIEVLDPQGQVWEIELDAASGELLEIKLDD